MKRPTGATVFVRLLWDWKFWTGLVISGLFLYFSLRGLDLHGFGSALAEAHYFYLIPTILITLLTFWIRAYRWRYLLRSVKPIGTLTLFSATMIGFAGNFLLPARLGELLRADAIARSSDISRSASFASIVVERILDGLTLLLFLAIILSFFSFPPWVKRGGLMALAMYLAVLAVLIALHLHVNPTLKAITHVLKPLPERISGRIIDLLRSFSDGLRVLSEAHNIGIVIALSLGLWLTVGAVFYVLLLGFDMVLPPHAPFVLLIILSLGIMLPSSPGFVGTFQYFCIIGLSLFGVPKDLALGYSVVLHISQYIAIVPIGLVCLGKTHLSLSTLVEKGSA